MLLYREPVSLREGGGTCEETREGKREAGQERANHSSQNVRVREEGRAGAVWRDRALRWVPTRHASLLWLAMRISRLAQTVTCTLTTRSREIMTLFLGSWAADIWYAQRKCLQRWSSTSLHRSRIPCSRSACASMFSLLHESRFVAKIVRDVFLDV